ncbi:Permeases of the major facilitator superfamily [Caballeronia glathei]|uniref:MFS transporter n=1 Tax=Caballeronia glathei TaxID=60547 RepID=A0A069PTP0_9BURK|nr:MFS transporter [Caballeronia glathei]KDR43965.1 MFS transporter [Caballeronia glathei]CDY74314.1 Permeases of the major facilitator superfamily [Caballeronia glathei]
MRAEDNQSKGPAHEGHAEPPAVSAGRAWYAVGVLLVAYVFSIMDRQILTLLVGPIQQTLHVNDTLMGMLHGFTFAAFYALMGLPIARIIDRGDRRLVIAIGIAMWSLATAAGGLATEYWHLLLARIGVAIGEAVLLPGAVSLIADLFAANQRGRAMNVFGASAPFGSGAGLIAGGLILGIFTLAPPTLPGFGTLLPWQATFVALGLPGVIVALFMLLVAEPRHARRGSSDAEQHAGARREVAASVPVSTVRRYIAENRRTMVALMLGAGFFYTCVYGWSAWAPTYFVREFGWKYSQIGKALGLLLAFVGPLGALMGGWLGGYWKRRGVAHGYLRVAFVGSAGLALSAIGIVSMPSANLALVFVALASCFSFFLFGGTGPAAIQELSPGPMRGQFAALYTGVLNLLGAGCGPVLVGLLTDYVLRNPMAIGRSIGIVCLVFGAIACVLFRSGFASYRDTLKNAADWRPGRAPASEPVTAKASAVVH